MKVSLNGKLRVIAVFFVFIILSITVVASRKTVYASEDEVSVIFTTDLHSHVSEFKTRFEDGQEREVGGFARLKTFIDKKKAENEDVLIVDSGDLIGGTLYQGLIDTEAIELSLLSEMGYDAVTMGNHDFDFNAENLSKMYQSVGSRYEKRPALVLCNLDYNYGSDYMNTLSVGLRDYGIKDYIIVEKNGFKIALTGVIGYNAAESIISEGVMFNDPIESVKNTVEKIKQTEHPDMIVCLSHSGTGDKFGNTEDEKLAKKVPDIDVIVSGHTHTLLRSYITVGDTSIISSGYYGIYAGFASFKKKANGRWAVSRYEMKLMDDSVEKDADLLEKIENEKQLVNENVLSSYGFEYDTVLAKNENILFEGSDEYYNNHTEMKLGNLLSDAYRYSAGRYGNSEKPFDIAIVPTGTMRGSFNLGGITVNDVFSVVSMGEMNGDNAGYPLAEAYLTGKEIKALAEIDSSLSDYNHDFRLHSSGLSFEYNPHRLFLNKVSDMWISSAMLEDSYSKFENNRLYHIVTDYYTMTVLNRISDVTKGLIRAEIKDANGNAVKSVDDCILYDKDDKPLKCFVAVAKYLKSFQAGSNGVCIVPEYYNSYHSRKVLNTSYSPVELMKNTSGKVYAFILIVILIIVLIIVIVRVIKRKKSKKKALYY